MLLAGRQRDELAAVMDAARWIQRHGLQNGFRVPTTAERARATGRGAYLLALGRQWSGGQPL